MEVHTGSDFLMDAGCLQNHSAETFAKEIIPAVAEL